MRFVRIYNDEGELTHTNAPSLSGMRKLFDDRNLLEKFEDYLEVEQTIWDELEGKLEQITRVQISSLTRFPALKTLGIARL